MANRFRPNQSRMRKIYFKTSNRTAAINLNRTMYRGGVRL